DPIGALEVGCAHLLLLVAARLVGAPATSPERRLGLSLLAEISAAPSARGPITRHPATSARPQPTRHSGCMRTASEPNQLVSGEDEMAKLKTKLENALNEGRVLVLGSQVLLGFQYEAFFQPGFSRLPPSAQTLTLIGLGLMLLAVAFLMLPIPFHQLV